LQNTNPQWVVAAVKKKNVEVEAVVVVCKYFIAECVLLYQEYVQLANPWSANIWPEVSAGLRIRHYVLQVLILPGS
jgi:hypothetical protein